MIRPLRRLHRWIWAGLALTLIMVYAAALLTRPAPPPPNVLPKGLTGAH